MKKIVFWILLLIAGLQLNAQTGGYLGKRNYVELKIGAVPTIKHQNVLKYDESVKRLKYFNTSYRLTMNRVLTKNFEISLGYEFARMNCISDGSLFNDRDTFEFGNTETYNKNFLDDPKMSYHGFQFAFNFYRLGSLAPIGKFIGFAFSYGVGTLAEGERVEVGQRGFLTKDSFFKKAGPIADRETFFINSDVKVTAFHLKARIGRNYPISDNMMISVGLTFPIVSSYTSGLTKEFGFEIDGEYDVSETSNWIRYSMTTIKYYNRVTLETGIRFHF